MTPSLLAPPRLLPPPTPCHERLSLLFAPQPCLYRENMQVAISMRRTMQRCLLWPHRRGVRAARALRRPVRDRRGRSPLDLAQMFDDDATKAGGGSAAEASVVHSQQMEPSARSHGLVVSLLRHVRHTPAWVPDERVERCESPHCAKLFSVTSRRHHCRHCGRVICGACAPRKMALPQLGYNKRVRVCQLCWSVLNFRKLA